MGTVSMTGKNPLETKFTEANLYIEQGLFDEAQLILETLLTQVGDDQPILRDKVEESIVRLHTQEVEINESSAGTTSDGLSSEDRLENCQGLMVAGFHAEAKEELGQLLQSGFRPGAIHAKLGECCLQQDNPFEAIEHFETALKSEGLDRKEERLSLLDTLSITYERTGSIPASINSLKQMVALDPAFRNAKQRLTTLSQTSTKFGRFFSLIRNKQLTPEKLEEAKEKARQHNKTIDSVLLSDFGVEKSQLGESLSEYYDCPFIEFSEAEVPDPPSCIQGIKENYFRTNAFIPLPRENGALLVLADDPNDLAKQDNIRSILHGTAFELAVALKEDISKFIDFYYGKYTVDDVNEDVFEELELEEVLDDDFEDEDDIGSAADGVVVQMANKVIEDAVSRGASDIHIESQAGRKGTSIRFRIDGACTHYKNIPHTYKRSLVSRLKILSKLDISERRLPQDGKIKFRSRRGKIELRVATIPTHGGNEDVVLRILAGGGAMPIEKMGMLERNQEELKRLIELPYGLMLVVGPTGSGKTTTLHGALNYVNRPEKKIWTVEDPVEIAQDGLRQVQVENKIGLDFAHVLRSFLRADPDIIMVGETRDQETAEIVTEAALTGHLVFSTLHTNTAPETVTRFLGMGIDPFNFADSLLGILAQRLVKRLCSHCKEPYQPNEQEKEFILLEYDTHPTTPMTMQDLTDISLYKAKGCDKCKKTGYLGRVAIHELLTVTDNMKVLIVKNSPIVEIRNEALQAGMLTLKQDGIWKVLRGDTDLLQVRAACIK